MVSNAKSLPRRELGVARHCHGPVFSFMKKQPYSRGDQPRDRVDKTAQAKQHEGASVDQPPIEQLACLKFSRGSTLRFDVTAPSSPARRPPRQVPAAWHARPVCLRTLGQLRLLRKACAPRLSSQDGVRKCPRPHRTAAVVERLEIVGLQPPIVRSPEPDEVLDTLSFAADRSAWQEVGMFVGTSW